METLGREADAGVASQLLSPDIDPGSTARIARAYFRAVATRLPVSDGSNHSCVWLDPETVWLALGVTRERALHERELKHVAAALERGRERPPEARLVSRANAGSHEADTLEAVNSGTRDVVDAPVMRVADDPDGTYAANLHEAIGILRTVWPASAVEFTLLIRQVIVLAGIEFTGSYERMFGTIMAGDHNLSSVVRAVEMILHETGHHSMFLRESFRNFVDNPDTTVHHPLRPDLRPISGTLHAAFVLWRMYHGFRRWSASCPADIAEQVRDRRADTRARLAATLEVLDENAAWTESGRALFANLTNGDTSE